MRSILAAISLVFLLVPWSACGDDDSGGSNDPYDAYRQACVDKINDYRATLNLPPYARWKEGESCADQEAKSDSETGTAHGAFRKCEDAVELEMAQNECPSWPSLESISADGGCLEMMWNEGPGPWEGHGHYINMTSTSYTKVACGFYVTPSGDVWAVQNFR